MSNPPAFPAKTAHEATGFVVREVGHADLPEIERLHDATFGPGALTRAAYRVREGQPPYTPFCRVLFDGLTLVAAIRYTAIGIGDHSSALMLGPLAVASAYSNQGHGRQLIAETLPLAHAAGIEYVLLVGDAQYYARFGFVRVPIGAIQMPGPIDPTRLLLLNLRWSGKDGDPPHVVGRVRGNSSCAFNTM